MNTLKIYGYSDDSVYLSGVLDDSFETYGDDVLFILLNDGTQIKMTYGDEGVWKGEVITAGAAKCERLLGLPDGSPDKQCHSDEDAPSYSDVMILTWSKPFELVKTGKRKLSAPPPQLIAGMELAKKVMKALEDRRGFDNWWRDIYPDDQDEIMETLAKILTPKATPSTRAAISGNTFVITGTLSISRAMAIQQINGNGGQVSSSVSSKVDYLICGDDPGEKLEKARELGITVLTEAEFLTMLP